MKDLVNFGGSLKIDIPSESASGKSEKMGA